MGEVKKLLDSLLLNIYDKSKRKIFKHSSRKQNLRRLGIKDLNEIEASLRRYINIIGEILGEELIIRDRYKRAQELLCGYVNAILHFLADNNHPPMRFSLTPPPAKSPHIVTSPTSNKNNNNSSDVRRYNNQAAKHITSKAVRKNLNNNMQAKSMGSDQQRLNLISNSSATEMANDKVKITSSSSSSEIQDDYNQWLHAMKLVARLPGGMPPEFRRKLWLTLAEKYLKSRNVDWEKEEKKCLSEEWREDDEELGIQIVKDLHRTGSNLCSGPAAKINQARLKRVLLGYARYNPEVGYCQGFNMLGALILQVMDKEEIESMKVMIYLVEGILPPGYFCGSMGGLQADMGVFRELMQCKLPRLAKHLEKLQGPVENAYEPPLTNVFTMQWFLTMFCTCLPMTCVLRVWDLVLIEGSDVLLRTALVLWSLLEERVLGTRSADDFYCKMGSFASELLNGHLIDSNSLIEKVVQLGPITDIEKLRNKHLYNITPIRHKTNLPLYLGDDEPDNDEDSRLAIATVWGIPWARRGSQSTTSIKQVPVAENKERLALDISLLKKQYDKLRERQKQAHIIITTACSTARQGTTSNVSPSVLPVNQLLMGRSAIVTNQGRRIAPPSGAIPPARKPSLPTILQSKPVEKQLRRGETLHWRDTDLTKSRRDSLTWKEIKADRINQSKEAGHAIKQSQKLRSRVGKSDSSSYSEESDDDDDDDNGSSTDTSLCDDDPTSTGEKTHSSSLENSPRRRLKVPRRNKGSEGKLLTSKIVPCTDSYKERTRPKSWAPSTNEIPFMLLTSDSPTHEPAKSIKLSAICNDNIKEEDNGTTECLNDRQSYIKEWSVPSFGYSPIAGDLATTTTLEPLNIQTDIIELPIITSASQLSPMPDITSFLKDTSISPLPTPKPSLVDSTNSLGSCDGDEAKTFDVSEDGVTNQYFERINSVERPTKLDLYYSLNEEDGELRSFEIEDQDVGIPYIKKSSIQSDIFFNDNQRPDLLIDHPQNLIPSTSDLQASSENDDTKDLLLFLGERDDNIPGENLNDFQEPAYVETSQETFKLNSNSSNSYPSRASQKRRDPRRLTLTRSTTIDIEERFQALEKHLKQTRKSEDLSSGYDTTNPDVQHETIADEHISSLNRGSSFINSSQEMLDISVEDNNLALSTRTEIPSTTDLEERFERQMSASEKTERNSIDIRRNSTANSHDEGSSREESKKENIKRENKNSKLTRDEEIETEKVISSTENNESKIIKSSPKRMPSTAELEERFDALEIKTKALKSCPSQSKKEPPDIGDASESQTSKNDVVCDEDFDRKRQSSKTDRENDAESTKKKTPPSTAELEKRFHALEKQMSTSSLANEQHEREEPLQITHFSKSKQSSETTRNDQEGNGKKEANEVGAESDRKKEILKERKSGRRSSEPPSTEDLERRYESLKRRMSTRMSSQPETIDEALQRIERNVIRENNYGDDAGSTIISESRLRIDARENDISLKDTNRKPTQDKKLKPRDHIEGHQVPDAPPLPPNNIIDRSLPNVTVSKEHQSLIEELQSKIELHSDEETLKPSSINPNRRPPPSKPLEQPSLRRDETSETHALTAFLRSENYEPWHGYAPKTVRRFSDLPSRADLENRLEFLEQKFYRKLLKQRCASDSEVASRKYLVGNVCHINDEASSSSGQNVSTQLEQRLQALEKQLSENSLKLLETMRSKAQEHTIESESRRRLSTDTMDATGKELVRYTHVGEIEESGALKPINISINIKMTIDKNAETMQSERTMNTTNDLERRLEALELQLKTSKKSETEINKSEQKETIDRPKMSEKIETASYSKTELNDRKTETTTETSSITKIEDIKDAPKTELKRQNDVEQVKNLTQKISSQTESNSKESITFRKEEKEFQKIDSKSQEREAGLEKEESLKPEEIPNEELIINEDQPMDSKKQSSIQQDDLRKKRYSKSELSLKEEIMIRKDEIKNAERSEEEQKAALKKNNCLKCPSNQKEDVVNSKEDIKECSKKTSKNENHEEKEEKCSERKPYKLQTVNKEDNTFRKDDDEESQKLDSKKKNTEDQPKNLAEKTYSRSEPGKAEETENETRSSNTTDQSIIIPKPEKVEDKSQKSEKIKVESTVNEDSEKPQTQHSEPLTDKLFINASEISSNDANKKTLVLLLDNEPKAVKVRRLTRANTEELEGLFQALEKQLQDRNLVKSEDGTLKHADDKNQKESKEPTNEAKEISELTKEIEEFTSEEKNESNKKPKEEEKPYDWGPDPIKRHLKRKTVHLPSTKELEARFRSLERQIKLLEDVENIDVEQRLHEIERKIKLQYSLAHETDLTKYLELCEGKGLDDEPSFTPTTSTSTKTDEQIRCECGRRTPTKASPGCATARKSSPSPSRKVKTLCTSPASSSEKASRDRPSRSKNADQKKQPIHPLEMLLDPSPDDSNIPTTGELEHRMRVLDEKHRSPTPPSRKSHSRSPVTKKRTPSEERFSRQTIHRFPTYEITPTKPEPPTAEELDARMRALEEEHIFDPKTQRNFKEFNEKLKNAISPSVSFEECKIESTRESSPKRIADPYRSPTSRSALKYSDRDDLQPRSTSPKVLRFIEDEDYTSSSRSYREPVDQRRPVGTSYGALNTIEENSKILHRILKKTFAEPKDERSAPHGPTLASLASEGLDALGSRLMRETSPLRRTGTVTGVPLRTDDNINERLSSIKDTIKSIDSLCEEKPYRKEKCQRYIDSLFSDSVHFAQKKTSLEDLRSRSASRTRYSEYTPSIHVSDLSQRPSDHYFSRSIGSAESIRTTSPLRAASPLHYRSNRDLTRNTDVSPARRGRRYDEDREECESRVRRNYMLPNSFLDNHSNISSSVSSLTKFYKVDSQLESYDRDKSRSHTPSRSPVRYSFELMFQNNNTSYTTPNLQNKNFDLDKPISPFRQKTHNNMLSSDYAKRLNTPVYNPGKLEIRHTTVTSTFYDRLLTEKQLEKSLSRPPSHSPVQATPIIGDRNYLESSTKAIANNSNDLFKVPSNFSPNLSSSTFRTPDQTSLHHTTITTTTNTITNTTTTGNLESYKISQTNLLCSPSRNAETIHNDLRIRSCDNIIMKLHSTSVTTANLTTSTSTTTLSSMMPISINSTLSYLNNANQTTTAATSPSKYTVSEPTPIGSTNSRSYLNLLNSSGLPTTSAGSITSNFSSFLPSISDKPLNARTPNTTSTGFTVPFIANSSIATLPSHTSTITTGAPYSLMSATFQPSTIGTDSLGLYSSTLNKNISNISSESYISSTPK